MSGELYMNKNCRKMSHPTLMLNIFNISLQCSPFLLSKTKISVYIKTNKILLFFFFGHYAACGILVPGPETEPGSLAVKALSLTTELLGNSPKHYFFNNKIKKRQENSQWYY